MFLSHESMVDLVALLNELVDPRGKILIPGIYDSVDPLTEEERQLYEPIDFDLLKLNNFDFIIQYILHFNVI